MLRHASARLVQRVLPMSVGRIENTINPLHLVTPERVVVPAPSNRQVIPMKKPFEAGPGVVPFHRMLEAQNLIPKVRSAMSERIETARNADRFESTQMMPSKPIHLLPTLGEVFAITPHAKSATDKTTAPPKTGRLLDLYF